MLTISAMKSLRVAHSYPRALLASITHIPADRLRELELRNAEPWFDEALLIARAFGCSVHDLLLPKDMAGFDDDPRFFAVDVKFWQDGVRLPLTIALRLQHRFGLSTVDELNPSALMRQLWSTLASGERHPEAPGWCSWCQADIAAGDPHTSHCLPNNLLGVRALRGGVTEEGTADAPRPLRGSHRTGSAKVHGLRVIREDQGLTQSEMARQLDMAVNHYARIERGELPLTHAKATLVMQLFNVSRDALFAPS